MKLDAILPGTAFVIADADFHHTRLSCNERSHRDTNALAGSRSGLHRGEVGSRVAVSMACSDEHLAEMIKFVEHPTPFTSVRSGQGATTPHPKCATACQ